MNWIDVSVVVIIALSALIGMARGLVREALALLGWVLATWVALEFSPALSLLITSIISIESLRYMIAFLLLFVITLVLAALLNHMISSRVRKSSLNGTDRALGGLFGVLRGVVLVAVLVWLAGFTKFPQHPAWKQAGLVDYFENVAGWMRSMIPPHIGKKLG